MVSILFSLQVFSDGSDIGLICIVPCPLSDAVCFSPEMEIVFLFGDDAGDFFLVLLHATKLFNQYLFHRVVARHLVKHLPPVQNQVDLFLPIRCFGFAVDNKLFKF